MSGLRTCSGEMNPAIMRRSISAAIVIPTLATCLMRIPMAKPMARGRITVTRKVLERSGGRTAVNVSNNASGLMNVSSWVPVS